jgi:RNA polymerase sigma-70 factor, ECF subfamily
MARNGGPVSPTPVDADEAVWVAACRRGEADAFRKIVERYQTRIHTVAVRMLGGRQEAQDVAQETFLKAFTALDRYDPTRSLATWLYRIAVNTCIDRLRKSRREVPVADPVPITAADALSHAESTESAKVVHEALGRLPHDYRTALILRDIEGLEYSDIVEVVGGSIAALKIRVVRGRRMLAATIKKMYPDFASFV